MNILLINPCNSLGNRASAMPIPSLSLPILAALTPSEFKVRIINEETEEIDYEEEVDLVGISCMTFQAPRAYEISGRFRQRGVKTILGGIHVSAMPDEALAHADAICIGEAENIWGEVLMDSKNGHLKKIYRSNSPSNLTGLPFPRLDLLKEEDMVIPIYSSRGCPYNCDFCAVSKFYGSQFRFRPIEEVVEEIRFRKMEKMESIGWIGTSQIIFSWIDDNICAETRNMQGLSFKEFLILELSGLLRQL